MNFRPTWLKGIVSLGVGILNDVIVAFVFSRLFQPLCSDANLNPDMISCPQIALSNYMFQPVLLGVSLIIAILVYVIWSSFQKN